MTTGNMVHCQLWMGGLEPYMTESFILASFQRMGEKPLNVKVMRNKFTGEPAGYCFVHFENDDEAIDAMHKLNGKVIPNTTPPVRFRLNTATNQGKIMMNEREFSLWVGDLTPEVDDYTLYKTFAGRYQSIKAAKVILDASGFSKGFGFLRFGSEDEQKHCLQHMNGYKGLGSKPLKISNAIPKAQRTQTNGQNNTQVVGPQGSTTYNSTDYSHYYDPSSYWGNYPGWGYGYDYNSYMGTDGYQNYYQQQAAVNFQQPAATTTQPATVQAVVPTADPSQDIIDHSPFIDVEKENDEYARQFFAFWDDVSASGWIDPEYFEMEMNKLKPTIID
ncbi:tRNA selenocysteine 1-associated protein 1 [Halyomorpha halys]|uniref:tRNA selenocysteine 1-associated protein 1 n=1 Tax=Halyomorpha halys TaxID=286706 RepID=UPI0006D4E879|nr:tRNA selenocysteine 1-associated protein 1 [Halyomorpha halys]